MKIGSNMNETIKKKTKAEIEQMYVFKNLRRRKLRKTPFQNKIV